MDQTILTAKKRKHFSNPEIVLQDVKSLKLSEDSGLNRERAYIAASHRADRCMAARIKSAQLASEVHQQRTGRPLRITELAVKNFEIYEEDDPSSLSPSKQSSQGYADENPILDILFAESFPNYKAVSATGHAPISKANDGHGREFGEDFLFRELSYSTQAPDELSGTSEPLLEGTSLRPNHYEDNWKRVPSKVLPREPPTSSKLRDGVDEAFAATFPSYERLVRSSQPPQAVQGGSWNSFIDQQYEEMLQQQADHRYHNNFYPQSYNFGMSRR